MIVPCRIAKTTLHPDPMASFRVGNTSAELEMKTVVAHTIIEITRHHYMYSQKPKQGLQFIYLKKTVVTADGKRPGRQDIKDIFSS